VPAIFQSVNKNTNLVNESTMPYTRTHLPRC